MSTALRSIGRRFAIKSAHLAAILGAVVCALIVSDAGTISTATAVRPYVTNSAAAIMDAHDCWGQGEYAPLDPDTLQPVLPSHAVVTVNGGEAPRYVGGRLASRAFDQTVGTAPTTVHTVHGFCR